MCWFLKYFLGKFPILCPNPFENLEGASFYSDSRNDLPLLLKVDHPHVVNPDPVLREQAEKAGWPIHHWK